MMMLFCFSLPLNGLKNFPRDLALRLKHLLLSHHGQYEFGAPKRPKFLEAFALHLIDDLARAIAQARKVAARTAAR